MDTMTLSATDRQQLEEVLDQFDRALKECRDGRLPAVDEYLRDSSGSARDYLRREMEAIHADLVRGEYVKLRRIGGGGMGEVFLARHLKLGRQFALKEIKIEGVQPADRTEFEKRFRREVEACGRLEHHPNLVSVNNTGTTPHGVPYLVMEYVDGEDLKQIVERNGPLLLPDACRIIHDAALGLAHAHEKGLVHRDVKPSNVMISKHGVVTVLDLGLARIIESDHHNTFVSMPGLIGSFDYMSPEQCREEREIDHRADVYSLGCTLYFLLAGRPPYADEPSIFKKLQAHQDQPAPPIARLEEAPLLAHALERMLAKAPADRYPDLSGVIGELRPLCEAASLQGLVSSSGSSSASLKQTRDDSGSTRPYSSRPSSLQPFASRPTPGGHDTRTIAVGSGATQATQRPPRFTRRTMLTALAAVGVAGTAGGLAYYFGRKRPPDAALTGLLATLPGLNGRWWFDETPWLLPDVRRRLAESLASRRGAAYDMLAAATTADVPAFHRQLRELVQEFRQGWPRDVQERLGLLQNLDPETLEGDGFDKALVPMTEMLNARRESEEFSAAEWHCLALAHHHRDDFQQADAAYEAAVRRYDAEANSPLLALCLSDWGQMRMKQRRYTLAQEKFNSARGTLPATAADQPWAALFQFDTLCNESDAHRGYSNWDPALQCLWQAEQAAKRLAFPAEHPLMAVLHERSAWYHLDVWRLAAAGEDFQRARMIREAHHAAGNQFAVYFVYWDRQGQAMVDFYQGQVAAAATNLRDMLDPNRFQGRQKQLELFKNRQPNLRERLADTALIDPSVGVDPLEQLKQAIDDGMNQGFREDGRRAVLVRLRYKAAVVAMLSGRAPDARMLLDDAERERSEYAEHAAVTTTASTSPVAKPRVYGYETTQKVALACRDWTAADAALRQQGLKEVLPEYKKSATEIGRDDLLVLLYVAEHLLRSKEVPAEAKGEVLRNLESLTAVRAKWDPLHGPRDAKVGYPPLLVKYLERARTLAPQPKSARGV